MYYGLGSALMFTAIGLGLGFPLIGWIITGRIDRDVRPVLYRIWCVCGVLALLGIYLMS
jgi:hypothetical protein